MFGFSKAGVLVSYIPKLKKNVLLLSILHTDNKIDEESDEQAKPEIIFYNLTKGGVDVNELKAQYSVSNQL